MRALLSWGPLALVALSACKSGPGDDPLVFEWNQGDRWHLATSYRIGEARTELGAVDLGTDVMPQLGEQWSDEIVWTFEVVEDGLVPASGDELYPYAVTPRGDVKALSVVRASIETGLNREDHAYADTNPTVYLVFREDRGRLAAVVSFSDSQTGRLEQAWTSKQLERSWSPLAQSMLSAAPTYLAPHGVRVTTGKRLLENGSTMDLAEVDKFTVDVAFDDEIGGGVVEARYEYGKPWPSHVVSDNVEVTLIDAADDRLRGLERGPAPENYDYRAALAASVDIDKALTITTGSEDFGAPDGYEPWNGSWWRQSEGALVFGYEGRSTVSDRVQATAEPIRKEMDRIRGELFTLAQGSTEYNTKVTEYRAKQTELTAALKTFYTKLRADLDGGLLKVEGGRLVHNEGWSYDLDELSPMDKTSLALYYQRASDPFAMQQWELLNHWSPGGGSWWGHCNGWAAAAILLNEPTDSVQASIAGSPVEFTSADLKGLFTETHYSTYSRFYGARYYKEGDDLADLHPEAFHNLVTFYLRDQRVPFVFDTTASDEVWNFPAYGADLEVTETTVGGGEGLIDINTATAAELDTLPNIGVVLAQAIIDYRVANGAFQTVDELEEVDGIGPATLEDVRPFVTILPVERTFRVSATVYFATDGVTESHVDRGSPAADGFTETYGYTLVTDQAGLVLSGKWDDDDKHPDFAWVPYSNPSTASYNSSENPYLSPTQLDAILKVDFNRK
jgi:competence ComEA-like helix-hairpin-helix protein